MQHLTDTELFAALCCASEKHQKKAAGEEQGGFPWGELLASPVGLGALGGLGGLATAAMTDDEEYVPGPDGRMVRVSKGKPWMRNALIGAGLGFGGGMLKNWLAGMAGDGQQKERTPDLSVSNEQGALIPDWRNPDNLPLLTAGKTPPVLPPSAMRPPSVW